MSKDRAAPFSRKHRKYWFTVTGGMLVIAGINVAIGMCSYEKPAPPERIHLNIPQPPPPPPGTIQIGDIPAPVMRAFAARYPQTIPAAARELDGTIVLTFPPGKPHHHATFKADGTFVTED